MLKLSWLLPLATLFQEMSALKKRRYEEIKRGECSEPRKKRKSETRGKNGQVSNSRIRGTRYPPERKEIENIEHLILLKKFQKSKKGIYPLKRAQVELDFHHCYHHHHHTPFATHAHLDLTYWLVLLDPWFDYAINVLLVCISCLPSMSARYKNLIRVGWERRQCHYAWYHKYHILWEMAYTITA